MGESNYYCYVSRFKVNQLYQQLSDFSVEETSVSKSVNKALTGGASVGSLSKLLEADISLGIRVENLLSEEVALITKQRFKEVLAYLNAHETIIHLDNGLDQELIQSMDSHWFLYKGSFNARNPFSWYHEKMNHHAYRYLIRPGNVENRYKEVDRHGHSLISDMCILYADYAPYTIKLACSFKYFSEMGGTNYQEQKEWKVRPHGGNRRFFYADVSTELETLFFVHGIKDNNIMGTPLFFIHSQDGKDQIYL